MAAKGMGVEAIARRLCVSERTLWNHLAADDSFREAWKAGEAEGVDFATGKLWELIEQGSLGALCFYLRAKGGFRAGAQEVIVRHEVAMPTITNHVQELAAYQTALLDGPDPDDDAIDVEYELVEGLS